jgi:large subunit ribosomal protein L28
MARICQITGKTTISGNRVSHSNIKTKRRFYPNLQYKRLWNTETQSWVELRLTPKGMRIIDRIGLSEALKRSAELGIIA